MISTTKDTQLDVLLNEIFNRYGYDFRDYARASIVRRINNFMARDRIKDIDELTHRIIADKETFKSLLHSLSVTVTEMFRDPAVYKLLRKKVIPYLSTYPDIKIWIAGCATGQEAYSIAILLHEAELYEKTQIYATDINEHSLQAARNGIYSNDDIKISTANYLKSGGGNSLSDYYYTKYNNSIISKKLKKNITFIKHNLVQNRPFNSFNLIMCRNVLIYFSKDLQTRLIDLFSSSLVPNGFLCLGTKESLDFIDRKKCFKTVDKKSKVYKKTII
jgi:chemotaxis protein methyltransferase CheR